MLTFVQCAGHLVRMAHKKTDFIASLAKGLRVIETFGPDRPRQSVAEAAEAAGLDRATARRCLLTLRELGYADHDGKHFQLTARVLRLGMGALSALPLPQIVQPWLDQLSDQIGQSASVSVLDETEIVYLARAAQRRVMSIGLMPGSRLPAHCTSMGRILLAALPEAEARALLDRSDLTPRTPHSLTEPEAIMTELARIRAQGYAIIDQEVEIGLRSIAVPILNVQDRTVAAMNVGLPALHADASALAEIYLPGLKRTQAGLRRVLH
ncbi:MAG: IclR family transcriptional regulator [Confluentimicrobium sp.]|nr:IclR family transcriptional regulator [Actibacterium sp.]